MTINGRRQILAVVRGIRQVGDVKRALIGLHPQVSIIALFDESLSLSRTLTLFSVEEGASATVAPIRCTGTGAMPLSERYGFTSVKTACVDPWRSGESTLRYRAGSPQPSDRPARTEAASSPTAPIRLLHCPATAYRVMSKMERFFKRSLASWPFLGRARRAYRRR